MPSTIAMMTETMAMITASMAPAIAEMMDPCTRTNHEPENIREIAGHGVPWSRCCDERKSLLK